MIKASCPDCGSLLFDCAGFESFHQPSPVDVECAGCGRQYRVSRTKGKRIVLIRRSGTKELPIEKYG